MGGGPPRFTRDITCPVILGIRLGRSSPFAYGAITLCGSAFQTSSAKRRLCNSTADVPQPLHTQKVRRFRLVPVRSPLLRESLLLSFPRATKMFQFARLPRNALCRNCGFMRRRRRIIGARLPHSEISGSKLACSSPEQFRCLPRPSSALSAKASTVRPYSLTSRPAQIVAFYHHYAVVKVRILLSRRTAQVP